MLTKWENRRKVLCSLKYICAILTASDSKDWSTLVISQNLDDICSRLCKDTCFWSCPPMRRRGRRGPSLVQTWAAAAPGRRYCRCRKIKVLVWFGFPKWRLSFWPRGVGFLCTYLNGGAVVDWFLTASSTLFTNTNVRVKTLSYNSIALHKSTKYTQLIKNTQKETWELIMPDVYKGTVSQKAKQEIIFWLRNNNLTYGTNTSLILADWAISKTMKMEANWDRGTIYASGIVVHRYSVILNFSFLP